MYRALSWIIDYPRNSSIDWNSDNAWAAGEGIISFEVNNTVPRAVYILNNNFRQTNILDYYYFYFIEGNKTF